MKKLLFILLFASVSIGFAQTAPTHRVASVELTRPADTTAYIAKDAISNSTTAPVVLTFDNLARIQGGALYIVKARLITDQSTNTARYRLHLYSTAPTPINDNAPYAVLYSNRALRHGYVDFSALATEGTGSTAAMTLNADVRLALTAADGSRAIYGMLEVLDGFTPTSGQKFFIELTADTY